MKIEYQLLHKIINNSYLCLIPNFYLTPNGFECDLFGMTTRHYTVEYEIKTTTADYHNDFNKGLKHTWIRQGKRTNRFYFVLAHDVVALVPDYAGLIRFRDDNQFTYVKYAPLIHKSKAPQELIERCLQRLSWRYYITTRG